MFGELCRDISAVAPRTRLTTQTGVPSRDSVGTVKDDTLSKGQIRSVRNLRFEPSLERSFAEQHTAATIGRVRIVITVLALFGLLGVIACASNSDKVISVVDPRLLGFISCCWAWPTFTDSDISSHLRWRSLQS